MIPNILTKIFGSRNERLLKQYAQVVQEINALEPAFAALTDEELRAKTPALKERVAKGVFTTGRSPKCEPARARRWSRHCRRT